MSMFCLVVSFCIEILTLRLTMKNRPNSLRNFLNGTCPCPF